LLFVTHACKTLNLSTACQLSKFIRATARDGHYCFNIIYTSIHVYNLIELIKLTIKTFLMGLTPPVSVLCLINQNFVE